jgi:hypothetical protein
MRLDYTGLAPKHSRKWTASSSSTRSTFSKLLTASGVAALARLSHDLHVNVAGSEVDVKSRWHRQEDASVMIASKQRNYKMIHRRE